ncbi:MAG: iron-containing alcohol dehydrogenase [Desulfobacterales bacterium]|nr:iron-containing alcohol dehydrogenase [Desulfobacterales bacterium]MBU0733745.1 iron-containing alcohol dehydrogenase [Pseudomonadota bacterium]
MQDVEKEIQEWEPTRIHFGEGTINKVGDAVRRYADNALVVIGQGSVKTTGVLDRITGLLDQASVRYKICEGVEPNPSKETVYRISYHLLAGNFTCLLAVGGGSVIDASKAAGILAKVKDGELDDYFGVGMVSKKTERAMDLVAVPTTSGSGSEVTRFSVITDPVLGVKKLMIDPAIVANEAIVDPELTYSCSKRVTLVSGLDAMTHLVEGYLNTVDDAADPQTNERALAGLSLLFEALPRIVRDPTDKTGRRNMALASLLGGTVLFYKQAGGPHLNSFSWCNVMDHGEACAVMLPYYGAYYAPVAADRLRKVSHILGFQDSGDVARDFSQGLLDFYRELGFPLTLKEFENFSRDLIEKAVSDAAQNKMKLEAMPRPVPLEKSESVLRTIIEGAYAGKLDEILKL